MALVALNFIVLHPLPPPPPLLSVKMARYVKYFTTSLQKKKKKIKTPPAAYPKTGNTTGSKNWRILNVECKSIFRTRIFRLKYILNGGGEGERTKRYIYIVVVECQNALNSGKSR